MDLNDQFEELRAVDPKLAQAALHDDVAVMVMLRPWEDGANLDIPSTKF